MFVITWEYPDKSAHGILAIYKNPGEAEFAYELLTDDPSGSRDYRLIDFEEVRNGVFRPKRENHDN